MGSADPTDPAKANRHSPTHGRRLTLTNPVRRALDAAFALAAGGALGFVVGYSGVASELHDTAFDNGRLLPTWLVVASICWCLPLYAVAARDGVPRALLMTLGLALLQPLFGSAPVGATVASLALVAAAAGALTTDVRTAEQNPTLPILTVIVLLCALVLLAVPRVLVSLGDEHLGTSDALDVTQSAEARWDAFKSGELTPAFSYYDRASQSPFMSSVCSCRRQLALSSLAATADCVGQRVPFGLELAQQCVALECSREGPTWSSAADRCAQVISLSTDPGRPPPAGLLLHPPSNVDPPYLIVSRTGLLLVDRRVSGCTPEESGCELAPGQLQSKLANTGRMPADLPAAVAAAYSAPRVTLIVDGIVDTTDVIRAANAAWAVDRSAMLALTDRSAFCPDLVRLLAADIMEPAPGSLVAEVFIEPSGDRWVLNGKPVRAETVAARAQARLKSKTDGTPGKLSVAADFGAPPASPRFWVTVRITSETPWRRVAAAIQVCREAHGIRLAPLE